MVFFFLIAEKEIGIGFNTNQVAVSFVQFPRQYVIISFCFKVPFREPDLIIKSLMCSILAEMTCETWKVNINFVVLSSKNDGFCAGMAISSFVCSLAHIFIYIFFPLCMKYSETWQAGCYLGEASTLLGWWRADPCVSWCRRPLVCGFGHRGNHWLWSNSSFLCCVGSSGDSYKEKENNQKEVWPNLQYLTLLGISSPFCNLN